jgi:hypothetical protein
VSQFYLFVPAYAGRQPRKTRSTRHACAKSFGRLRHSFGDGAQLKKEEGHEMIRVFGFSCVSCS